MDRTSRIGIVVCFAILVYLAFFHSPKAPATFPKAGSTPAAVSTTTPVPATLPNGVPTPAHPAAAPSPVVPENVAFLENDDFKVFITSNGAAVKSIELKKHKGDHTAPVHLNEEAHANILQLTGWPGAEQAQFSSQHNGESIVYSTMLPNGAKWERTYSLGKSYTLTVRDTLQNTGAQELVLPTYGLSVGRAEPLLGLGGYDYRKSGAESVYLGIGWLTRDHFHLTTIGDFNPGTVPLVGIKLHEGKDLFTSTAQDAAPLRWIGAENQFFTVLLTPTPDHLIDHAQFQCFNQRDPDRGTVPFPSTVAPDIEGTAFFPELRIPAGQSVTTTYSLYAGPKDYDRLNALGEQQGELMNYGKFEVLIIPMLGILHFFHSFLGNYGMAIILLTLTIKGLTWPLQSIANRSGKRMQAVAPKLKELQAKYKETPEKLNTETFALYKEYGVNPFGGCLPALIQMPVFFSLYYMLQNAGELRGQSFLWIRDLTQADTIASVQLLGYHLALNPLPLMVTGLTMVMMRMTPQMGDPQQAKIAQFMPVIFLVFLYNFAAALSLYYVINNCVSIFQIYRNLKKPLPELKRVVKKKTAQPA